ncbi:hypothetical protein BH10PSE19_BH10PSE19_05180 [soil metagenome]
MSQQSAQNSNTYSAFLEIPAVSRRFPVNYCHGNHHGLNENYCFEIAILNMEEEELYKYIGQRSSLTWSFNNERISAQRYIIHGYLTQSYQNKFILRSPLHSLSLGIHSRMYVDKNIQAIITAVLQQAGWHETDYVIKLQQQYPRRASVLQYQQSDLDFLQQQLAYWGLIYCFKQHEHNVQLYIVDDILQLAVADPLTLRYQPGNGQITAEAHIYAIQSKHQLLPQTLCVNDYNSTDPSQSLKLTKENASSIPGFGTLYRYGENYQTRQEGQYIVDIRLQALAARRYQLQAWSNNAYLQPGQLLHISDPAQYQGSYRIITLEHYFGPRSHDTWRFPGYKNKITLIPATTIYRPYYEKKSYQAYLPAIIESSGGLYPDLDEEGSYRIRFNFDKEHPQAQASPPIRLAQPHSGIDKQGLHWPLAAGTEVLVGFINGDSDRPVLLGALPNANHPGPLNYENSSQYQIQTKGNNYLILDDSKVNPGIQLATAQQENALEMRSSHQQQQVKLDSKQGSIYMGAGAEYKSCTAGLHASHIGRNHHITIEKDFYLATQQQDILYQAGNHIKLSAQEQKLQLQTEKGNLTYKSKQNSYWQSKEATVLNISTGNLVMQVPQGKLQYQAQQTIQMQAQQQFLMAQGGGRILIDATGQIHLQAAQIFIHGTLEAQASAAQLNADGKIADKVKIPDNLTPIIDCAEIDKRYWTRNFLSIAEESVPDSHHFYMATCSNTSLMQEVYEDAADIAPNSSSYHSNTDQAGLSLLPVPKGEQLQQLTFPKREIVQVGERKLPHPLDWIKPNESDFAQIAVVYPPKHASIPRAGDLELQIYSLFPPILINLRREDS